MTKTICLEFRSLRFRYYLGFNNYRTLIGLIRLIRLIFKEFVSDLNLELFISSLPQLSSPEYFLALPHNEKIPL